MDSHDNQEQSTIVNHKMNKSRSNQKSKKNFKKKNRKFFQRTKSFGNSLYELNNNKGINAAKLCRKFESSLLEKTDSQLFLRSNADPTLYLNDYSCMSNGIFKEKFIEFLGNQHDRQFWIEIFNNQDALIFIQGLTQYKSSLSYFNLQYDQWTYYRQLGMTENIWYGRVSKKMAMVNSMCVSYGRGKALVEQRQNYFQKQIGHCKHRIEEYEKQKPLCIDLKELQSLIHNIIEHDQYQLRIELEQQRHFLKFAALDHRLVETFYELNPRKTEISSAKTIWKATHYEQLLQHELTLFKKWMSLSEKTMTMDTIMDLGLDKINEIFTFTLTTKALSNSLSTPDSNETSLRKLISESINETITFIEKNIQNFIEIAHIEKQKILSKRNKFKKLPTVDSVMNAIENRQQNMIQRAQYHLEQTMKTIFRDQ